MASAHFTAGRLGSLLLAVGLVTILAGGTVGPAVAGGEPTTVTLTSPAGGWSAFDGDGEGDGGHNLATIAAPSAGAGGAGTGSSGTPLLVGLGLVLVAIGMYLILSESLTPTFR